MLKFLFLFAFICVAQSPSFIIKTNQGDTILKTKDSALVRQFSHVKIDTVIVSDMIFPTWDTVKLDYLRTILVNKLGKPDVYNISWSADSIYISIIRGRNRPYFVSCNKAGCALLKRLMPLEF